MGKAVTDERFDMLSDEIEFQKLNEVLGKPVDLAKVWEAFEELSYLNYAAIEDARDGEEWAIMNMEEAETERQKEEERADNAEKEVLKLQDEVSALENRIEELERECERPGDEVIRDLRETNMRLLADLAKYTNPRKAKK